MTDEADAPKGPKNPVRIPNPNIKLPQINLPQIAMPDFSSMIPRPFEFPEIRIPTNPLVSTMEANYASEFHKRLVKWINDFNASLDNEHEVGVRLVSFGQTVVFHLEDIGYWNPSLICFKGKTEQGNPVELIAHVSQISILLTKLPRENPSVPKRPIGFHSEDSDAA